ncbi:mercury resistance protein MerE [Klebsiella pneumoniae]|nr:mercury resistance protein MerE [Klebsiella pneumoniae]
MNSPERLPSETHKPITGYLWGALAVLTCPAICRFSPLCWPARRPARSSESTGVSQPSR